MKAKTWVLAEHFEGEPQEKNLQLVEEDLPEIKDGGIYDKHLIHVTYVFFICLPNL